MYGFYLRRDMHGYFQINQSIHHKIVEPRATHPAGDLCNFAGRIGASAIPPILPANASAGEAMREP